MPGCFTPTEILDAHGTPAPTSSRCSRRRRSGRGFIKDVRAPLPQVKLMPTGGVTLDNAGDWIRAGAVAVGVGSALLDARAIDDGKLRRPRATTRARIVASVAAARGAQVRRSHATRSSRSEKSCCGSARRGSSGSSSRRSSSATFGGGEANVAVSLAQFGLDSHYVTRAADARRSATRRSGRCAPKASAPIASSAAAIASASTSPRPAPASAPRPSSTTARTRRSARCRRRRGRLGRR